MKKKKLLKKFIFILLIAITILSNFINMAQAYINIGDSSRLYEDKELLGLLQYKSNGSLKLVMRVYYLDPETNQKMAAFCLEPEKPRSRYWSRLKL